MSDIIPQTFSLSNAAGTCKTLADVQKLARSGVTAILVGSGTVPYQPGNPGTNHYQGRDGAGVNSLGLPNLGRDYYAEHLPEMREIAHATGKKLDFSFAPFSLEDTDRYAAIANLAKVDSLELNAGCPNAWAKGKQKKILSFHPRLLEKHLEILIAARTASRHPLTIRVKLSPYSDPAVLARVAKMIGRLGTPRNRIVIVTANTFPNAYMFTEREDELQPAIPFGEHLGGWSGDPYRAIVLGQVAQYRKILPDHPIIGVGGISRGRHIWEYLHFKVQGVQIGSAYYYTDNPRIFSDLLEELFSYPVKI